MANHQNEKVELKVLELLEEFEDKLEGSPTVPLTGKILVDREEFLSLLKDIHVLLPDEYQHVRWMKSQQEQIMEEARQEASRIVNEARQEEQRVVDALREKEDSLMTQAEERVRLMVNDHEIMRMARQRAEEIVNEAEIHAKEIREGSYEYADELMKRVEYNMGKMLQTVQENIQELNDYK